MDYDVIIVGAGPAGLNAARFLEDRMKVLIIEKNEIVGPKICAGGLTRHSYEYLQFPGFEKAFNETKLFINGKELIVKKKEPYIYTIDRTKLAEFMIKRLNRCRIQKGTRIDRIEGNKVICGKKSYSFRYLIGSDGSASIVRQHLGLGSRIELAMQYRIKGKREHAEFHFDPRRFGSGYAWIFPHRGYISIGCGCDPKNFDVNLLRKNLDNWCNERGLRTAGADLEAFPINHSYKGMRFGNIFLCGDAAGLASGLTGEGIYQALISGEYAASQILVIPPPEEMKGVLRRKRLHDTVVKLMRFSPPRYAVHEILRAMLKSERMSSKIISSLL